MPSSDEQFSNDEIKVFKDEEDYERSCEDTSRVQDRVTEDKSSLITETQDTPLKVSTSNGNTSQAGIIYGSSTGSRNLASQISERNNSLNYYYPYSYNGSFSLAAKVAFPGGPPNLPSFLYGVDSLTQPPPAHSGIPKSLYPLGTMSSQCSVYPPSTHPFPPSCTDLNWNSSCLYPAASGVFRSVYPGFPSGLQRFSPHLLSGNIPYQLTSNHDSAFQHHNGVLCNGTGSRLAPATSDSTSILSGGGVMSHLKSSTSAGNSICNSRNDPSNHHGLNDSLSDKKKSHIKKPLNAFMLYMKEMRAKVVAECTLKESAAINQILGRRWHALNREEQSKYYEMAKKERQNHLQLYPGWSARDNYAQTKKKKRKRTKIEGAQMKKCRARYGLEQLDQWCKPCRRKKKCIRYMEKYRTGMDEEYEEDLEIDDNSSSGNTLSDPVTPFSDDASSQTLSDPEQHSTRGRLNFAHESPVAMTTSPAPHSVVSSSSLLSPLTVSPPPARPDSCGSTNHSSGATPTITIGAPRTPVGANPRDANNPLSVNQLTNCYTDSPKRAMSSCVT